MTKKHSVLTENKKQMKPKEDKWQDYRVKFNYISITLIVDGLNTKVKSFSDWI